jgi:hypothetical protein
MAGAAGTAAAHQVVVAGDDRQLPPTNFFRQADSGDPGDDDDLAEETVSFGAGFESVLDALRPLLPTCPLNWHYRSRDERLVAFSNDRIYGGALTTFPGVARDDCLQHVVVAQDAEPGQESSVSAEVAEVVRLILEHALARPEESLGVIALGMRHAERIDTALRAALTAGSADLETFFAEDVPEPFFVKNLERVQGDERDATPSPGAARRRAARRRVARVRGPAGTASSRAASRAPAPDPAGSLTAPQAPPVEGSRPSLALPPGTSVT